MVRSEGQSRSTDVVIASQCQSQSEAPGCSVHLAEGWGWRPDAMDDPKIIRACMLCRSGSVPRDVPQLLAADRVSPAHT